MATTIDHRAVYEPRTDTVRTGQGWHIRVEDLHRALTMINDFQLRKLVHHAGIAEGVTDPMDASKHDTIRDVLDLCRGLPQYTLPLVDTALGLSQIKDHFKDVIRDRMFGSSAGQRSRFSRPEDAFYSDKIRTFFHRARGLAGEFGFFIRHDRKVAMLRPGTDVQATKPFEECFYIVRTEDGRYWLRWPDDDPESPAWYLDAEGEASWFLPRREDDDPVDFEELFPGYTYEVYGVQFSLPDQGFDYRGFQYEGEDEEPTYGAPPAAGSDERRLYLLELLEVEDADVPDGRALSKVYRALSVRWHPLKHLHANEEDKVAINARYLEITNAYNELKKYYQGT